MSKHFLFGDMYDMNDDNFSKVKEDLYKSKTPYEINKNSFIVSIYDKPATMKVSYNTLKKNVIPIEIAKGKDLMYFSAPELFDLMNLIQTSSTSTKERLYHLIDNYLDWCINTGNITSNNLKGLQKEELCKINKRMASGKVISMNDFFDYCNTAEKSDEVSAIDIMPLVMARYGIVGEKLSWIINLKHSNLDYESKTVRILEGDNEIILPVDDNFFEWVKKCDECKELDGYEYIYSDTIIRQTTKFEETELNDTYIYNRIDKVVKKTMMPRMSFKLLEFSRKMDFLLSIREERVLTSEDFRVITRLFNPSISASATNVLIKTYESVTDDKVKPMRSKEKVKIVDDNPTATVEKIKKQIGYIREQN